MLNTMGTRVVACFALIVTPVVTVYMRSTPCRSRSFAADPTGLQISLNLADVQDELLAFL
jgi:hypothetical protein